MSDRRRRLRGLWMVGIAAAVAAGSIGRPPVGRADDVVGDPATTRPTPPSTAAPEPPTRRNGRPVRLGAGPGGGLARVAGPILPGERAEAMKFMEQYAPESYKAISNLPEGSDERNQKERFLTRAYLTYQQLRGNDADGLYDVLLKRVRAEDRLFGLTVQYRRASAKEREALVPKLRSAVTEWAGVSLQERQLRLDRLERAARQERKRLDEDRAHRDKLIDDRLTRITTDAAPDALPGSDRERDR